MADSSVSIDKLKAFWHSQVHDEEKWALNMVHSLSKTHNFTNLFLDLVILPFNQLFFLLDLVCELN